MQQDAKQPCYKENYAAPDTYNLWIWFMGHGGGGVLNKTIPVVCGGQCYSTGLYCGGQLGTTARNDCFSYDSQNNQWSKFVELEHYRYHHATVVINDEMMWLLGKYFTLL